MVNQRILACGDNHGDIDSLEKLVEATAGEEFDFIIHTGDITNTYKTDLETGVDQLQAVEKYFEKLAERGTLVYIYGNRDYEQEFGGSESHVSEEYELSVGHRLQAGDELTVDGQRFTANPADASPDDILLTHGISQGVFFQSPARAYLCGDTHRARQFKTGLNTGYLHNDKGYNGAYFTATLNDSELEATVHGLDEPWKGFFCPDHEWYGQQFTPEKFGCGLCEFGPSRQFDSIAYIAFDRATSENEEVASIGELIVAARDSIVDDDVFAKQFRSYLEGLANTDKPHPTKPLKTAEESRTLRLQ